MYNYAIPIPNDRIKTYKVVTFIVLTLNFLGFGYVFLQTSATESKFAIIALVLNAMPWLYYLLNKKHLKSPALELTIILSALVWMYFGNIGMGILLVIFGVMSFFTNKSFIILFDKTGIVYPTFPTKKYAWVNVAQVLWKDDILTIDLANNKLLQFTIDKNFAERFDVLGFNKWCSDCINYAT